MTISSALNAGVAGLQGNSSRLAAISDNIANASTFGFRRVETSFESLVLSSSGGAFSAGGVRTSTQRVIDQGGSLISTSNPTDLAVQGQGMLPVARTSELQVANGAPQMLLTTTGSFRPDAEGRLVTPSGLALLGWPAASDGTVPEFPRETSTGLEPVRANPNQLTSEPTTQIELGVNLPATATVAGATGAPQPLTVEYFDNLGSSERISIDFVPDVPPTGASNLWRMVLTDSAQGGAVIGEYDLQFDSGPVAGGTLQSVTTLSGGAYDPATGKVIVNVASGPIEVSIGKPGAVDGLTQLGDSFIPQSISKDGAPVSNMVSVQVDENGFVRATFDTGITRVIFQVPLVDLPNPNGLTALDDQTYLPSRDSGPFFLRNAGDGPTGDIVAFAREESTTDIARELTDMIQTQRAYSSNATVIQTVDEILQETNNLKR